MQTVPLIVPVRYRCQRKSKLVQHIGFLETSLVEVGSDEAPVAVRWQDGARQREYRSFDGSLWHPASDRYAGSTYTLDSLYPFGKDDTRKVWLDNFHDARSMMNLFHHPFKSRRPWARWFPNMALTLLDATPSWTDEFELASAEALARVRQTVSIDGVLWERGNGPVLEFRGSAKGADMEIPVLVYHNGENFWHSIDNRAFLFDGLSPEAAMDAVSRHFRGTPVIVGERPEILIDKGYSTDPMDMVAESTAWHMVWVTKDKPLSDVPLPPLDALRGLREAMELRWLTHELNFRPAFHDDTWEHLHSETLPDGADLSPAITRFAETCDGVVPDQLARGWRMNADRIRLAYGPGNDDDLAMVDLDLQP